MLEGRLNCENDDSHFQGVLGIASYRLMMVDVKQPALLSEPGRSHCPCIAIRWGRTSHCCLQPGRTGGSVLWLCRSHCRGIESQKGCERARKSANYRGLQQPFGSHRDFKCSCLRNLANFGELLRTERVEAQSAIFWTLSHSPGQLQGDIA